MANALPGLQSLYAKLDIAPAGSIDEGALEARANPIDERHAQPGDSSGEISAPAGEGGTGYKGQMVYEPSGLQQEFGNYPGLSYSDPGRPLDETPSTHGGKWPRPGAILYSTVTPDDFAFVGDEIAQLHGEDQGGPRVLLGSSATGFETPTDFTTDRYDAPNENMLASTVPGQLRGPAGNSGGHLGGADTTQGYGVLNTIDEFTRGHSIRRVQHDHMPWDYSLLHGEEGTWLGKHPVGLGHTFDGPDSPYYAMGNPDGSQRAGMANVLSYPSEYSQPPNPTVLASASSASSDVWAEY